ncbi:MAG TPA: [FeFe] hydrogenase H-cluster radical SAM maturase HydE [Candidatus Tidjanibacter gallistercoris]|nr:[FeFe] hydrogenase H-cluster radical SAM maturase HydE [Candidatus Tidjanibacter gallistercoris]
MKRLIDALRRERHLEPEGYAALLEGCREESLLEYAMRSAREVAVERFGRGIFIRGLIEITNYCRNDCYYCGIRRSNRHVERYRLSGEEILECCRTGYALGFRTFVLQGGEDAALGDAWTEELVRAIRREFPDCAITLSLGERTREAYLRFYEAGANRYLLRHETATPEHYSMLHPASMSFEHRMQNLRELKEIGYQTGTGIMVGSPWQTTENVVRDIRFIEAFRPQMIGLGPYIPQNDTPFAGQPAGSIRTTLMLLAIFRLLFPDALIPSTTALATLAPDGREQGILAGANVVMPNLSPPANRAKYALYNDKKATGLESAEGLRGLEAQLNAIGYHISYDRGDYSAG